MERDEMREAVVWGIVFEKTYAQHEYDNALYPTYVTDDEIRASKARSLVALVAFASEMADRVCKNLKELKPAPPRADE